MLNESDKLTERDRYNSRAKLTKYLVNPVLGSENLPKYLADPYLKYESFIKKKIFKNSKVLELGAGTGEHTKILLDTHAKIVISDISIESLRLAKKKFRNHPNLRTRQADIEHLPFKDSSFDFICCAGSLSYGVSKLVDREILRVLRPGGTFICVDSLNHNQIYKFNRWLHYLFGRRTRGTLINMPSVERLTYLSHAFKKSEIYYFGAFTFLMPLMIKIVGENLSAKISNYLDAKFKIEKSAFKFVFVASNLYK